MSQTIAIYSPKGGVGRSFIATNLSASLAQKLGKKKVLLIDLDLQLPGDILKLLDLSPKKNISELVPEWKATQQLDLERLSEYIIHHAASGLDFLPIIFTLRQRLLIDEKFITALLKKLGQAYEFILFDGGSVFSRVLLAALENSNLILFVVNPDVLSVSQVKEYLDLLQSFSFPVKMMKAVLNRAESVGGVSMMEVRQALPFDIVGRIPSEGRAVVLALNKRIPLVLDNPQSRPARAIIALADDLVGHPEFFVPHTTFEAALAAAAAHAPQVFADEDAPAIFWHQANDAGAVKQVTLQDRINQLKQRIHKRIIQDIDLHRIEVATDQQQVRALREDVKKIVSNAIAEEAGGLISSPEDREKLIKEIIDEAVGLGPLEDLVADPDITDIMVNNKDQIYIEKHGKLQLSGKHFGSNKQVRQVIERIVAPLGRRIDESSPMVDGRLVDGSRVNAIIPPLALTGPTLTIRKFSGRHLSVSDLITQTSSMTQNMGDFIKACVLARRNVIVSGGTGSGKTTVLNVLSEFIPDGERIVTIEDAAELKLHHAHWVRLETRAANIEGKGAVTMRDLFRNSLRMRPDRIIIGECRGLETLDMLQAMNTGHDGSMTTLHANSTRDVLSRLDSLILMGGIEIPIRAIHEMVASAINIIVHTARLGDGSRKVLQISEVTGVIDEMHIGFQDIFAFRQTGVSDEGKVQGYFTPTGNVPEAYEEIRRRGIPLSSEIFKVPA